MTLHKRPRKGRRRTLVRRSKNWNHAGSFRTLDDLRADEDMAWLFDEA